MFDFANAKAPLIPRHPKNPVGQTLRIQRARKAYLADIVQARKMALDALESWPTSITNDMVGNAFYEYLIDLSELTRLVDAIRRVLGDGQGAEAVREAAEAAYREGTAKAVENLSGILEDYTRTVTQRLGEQQVLKRAALAGSRAFEQMQGFSGDTAQDLSRVLFRAVQDGENPRETAKTIRERFNVSKGRADRIARTEITGALRRGRWDEARDAEDKFGVEVRLIHYSALIAGRTRRSHAARHGRVYTTEETAAWYASDGNAINCVLPGTRVKGAFVAGSKARYEGPVIRMVTANGDDLTVTPNHPMLTDRGVVPAREVKKGCHLVCDSRSEKGTVGVGPLNGQLPNATAEQVFGALANMGHSFPRRVLPVDFDGDAGLMNEQVEIVNADGPLVVGDNASSFNRRDKLGFAFADFAHPRFSAHPLGFDTIIATPASFVRRLHLGQSLGGGHSVGTDLLRRESVPNGHVEAVEVAIDGGATDAVSFREREDGSASDMVGVELGPVDTRTGRAVLSGLASYGIKPSGHRSIGNAAFNGEVLDEFTGSAPVSEVVKVEVLHFSGHVYDFQDVTGLIVANNIVTRNCLCTQSEITVDENGEPMFGKKLLERLADRRKQFLGAGGGVGGEGKISNPVTPNPGRKKTSERRDAIRETVIRDGKRDGSEHAYIVSQDGVVLGKRTSGASNYVQFQDAELDVLNGETPVDIIHNHPTENGLSDSDFISTSEFKAVRRIEAITPQGAVFSGRVRQPDKITKASDDFIKDLISIAKQAQSENLVSRSDLELTLEHMKSLALRRDGIVDYDFTLSRPIADAMERLRESGILRSLGI